MYKRQQILIVPALIFLIALSGCQQQSQPPTATPKPATSTNTATIAVAVANTSTPTATVTATTTSTAIALTPPPQATLSLTRPTRQPTWTPFIKPTITITPSGPLVGASDSQIVQLMTHGPKSLGGFPIDLTAISHIPPNYYLVIKDGVKYGLYFHFYDAADSSYYAYNDSLQYINNGQSVDIGDQAIINDQGEFIVALMRYRNVFIIIEREPARRDLNLVPVTNEQLKAVLFDLYQMLKTEK